MKSTFKNFIISIDGPAGSGKQLISKYIAKKYKFFHLDSGILYRRLVVQILKKNIKLDDLYNLKKFIGLQKKISSRNHSTLRKENISIASSKIAVHEFIRNYINKQQRIIVLKKLQSFGGCVIDGRDIGSNVFKDAKIKLFIDVKAEIRAKRRHKQLIALGEKSIYPKILKEIKLRDKLDKNRNHSPLVIPNGAIIINNSNSFQTTKITINKILNNLK